MGSGLDWAGLMRAGIRGLGLQPDVFWRLSPAELALMLGEAAGTPPLTRGRLEELAAQWPDKPAVRVDEVGGAPQGPAVRAAGGSADADERNG